MNLSSEIAETLAPEEFMNLTEQEKNHIVSVKFIAPKLGESHFGKVTIKTRYGYATTTQRRRRTKSLSAI